MREATHYLPTSVRSVRVFVLRDHGWRTFVVIILLYRGCWIVILATNKWWQPLCNCIAEEIKNKNSKFSVHTSKKTACFSTDFILIFCSFVLYTCYTVRIQKKKKPSFAGKELLWFNSKVTRQSSNRLELITNALVTSCTGRQGLISDLGQKSVYSE